MFRKTILDTTRWEEKVTDIALCSAVGGSVALEGHWPPHWLFTLLGMGGGMAWMSMLNCLLKNRACKNYGVWVEWRYTYITS